MTKRELVAAKREEILALAAAHGASKLRIFGSVARGDDDADSDVDVLAVFSGKEGWDALSQPLDFEEALSALLGCKAHVLSDHDFMRPRLRQNIEQDLVPL